MGFELQFSDKEITAWGGMGLMKRMLDHIGFDTALAASGLPPPGSNRGYRPGQLIVQFILSVWCGANRFEHGEVTRHDPVLQRLFGGRRLVLFQGGDAAVPQVHASHPRTRAGRAVALAICATRRGRINPRSRLHRHDPLRTARGGCARLQPGVHQLVYYELHVTMADAIAREKQIKAGSRAKKLSLVESSNPDWRDLYSDLV